MEHFLIGEGEGTNIIRKDGSTLLCLVLSKAGVSWVENPGLIRYFTGEGCVPVTEQQAKKAYARITNNQEWV